MMSVAFPDLIRSFPEVSSAQLSWVLNSYTIVAGATLILAAVVCDRFGRKRMLLTGVAIFTVAAVACALAPNPSALIAARVVQALGWSLITPSSIAVILADVPINRRAISMPSGVFMSSASDRLLRLTARKRPDMPCLPGNMPRR